LLEAFVAAIGSPVEGSTASITSSVLPSDERPSMKFSMVTTALLLTRILLLVLPTGDVRD
jgi:hypothetical protein